MKKLFLLLALICANTTISYAQPQLDTRTQNQIKAKFFAAEDLYAEEKYADVLEKVAEIEELTGGKLIATAQNLKVKALIGLERYDEASEELYTLQGLTLTNDIVRDVSKHEGDIKKGKQKIIEEQQRIEQERLQKEEEQRRKAEIRKNDRNSWYKADDEDTLEAYEAYLANPDNTIYREEAEEMAALLRLATKEGLEAFVDEHSVKERLFTYDFTFVSNDETFSIANQTYHTTRRGNKPAIEVFISTFDRIESIGIQDREMGRNGSHPGLAYIHLKGDEAFHRRYWQVGKGSFEDSEISTTSESKIVIYGIGRGEEFFDALVEYVRRLGHDPQIILYE